MEYMNYPEARLVKRLALITLFLCAGVVGASGSDRIYGKITTTDGDTYQGLIRWDRNEVSWVDQLNGTKEISRSERRARERSMDDRERRRKSKVQIFGIEVGNSDWEFSGDFSSEASIRFGHIKKMIAERGDRISLILKSGDTVEFEGGSTDFGSDMRELIIEDERDGETELSWEDIEEVELMPTPANIESELGTRLYGTMTTRRGDEFTGYVSWDADECLTTDVIDGEDHDKTRKLKLGRVTMAERYSSNGAEFTLTSGEKLVLKGTNDVDNGNRGISIEDPALGAVTVEWSEFDKLEFKPLPGTLKYDSFSGGKRIRGTVTTEDGDTYTGDIRWDNDEAYTWEPLNGESRGAAFRIEFGTIKSIERDSYRGCQVTLWDGRVIDLRESNDVDESNRGLVISPDGKKDVVVDWDEFKSVEFVR
jgi:hypothetical protein